MTDREPEASDNGERRKNDMYTGSTSDGRPVTVTLNVILQWVMGIAATLCTVSVVWLVNTVAEVKETQSVMQAQQAITESNRFRQEDWIRESALLRSEMRSMNDAHVSVREFTDAMARIESQLAAINRNLEGRNDR